MTYKDFNIGDWIGHISGAIEDERELDGNEMRDLVEFLTKQKSAIEDIKAEIAEIMTEKASALVNAIIDKHISVEEQKSGS